MVRYSLFLEVGRLEAKEFVDRPLYIFNFGDFLLLLLLLEGKKLVTLGVGSVRRIGWVGFVSQLSSSNFFVSL